MGREEIFIDLGCGVFKTPIFYGGIAARSQGGMHF
jgi:hypothetical protein